MSETTALQLRIIPPPKTSTAFNGCKLQAQVDLVVGLADNLVGVGLDTARSRVAPVTCSLALDPSPAA
ncbi:hypothetical protein CFAM422_003932 [Trichoderma lentiforme]|uniref:Uncharacterized protein n=1 Tax=Trichoderma lentiforme TaxID=1567552 RepID=A0A9P4XL05_9HYPO|nr:hypothetical protein CFAM422_003932 [Trichoderma lentiforme]